MNKARDKEAFAQRLNAALDRVGAPPLHHGRIDFLRRIYAHVTGQTLSGESLRRWLSGDAIPHTHRIADLASVLDTSGEYLLTGRGNPVLEEEPRASLRNPDEARLIDVFRRLRARDRTLILGMLELMDRPDDT